MLKSLRTSLLLLIILALHGAAYRADAQTAGAYIAIGRGQLTLHTQAGLQAADAAFDSALVADANSEEANVLKAATRLTLLLGKPELQTLLTSLGVTVTDSNPYNFIYNTTNDARHKPVPALGSSSDMVIGYLNASLLPELDGAISNLQKVTSTGFQIYLSAQETSLLETWVDYGDVKVALGALQGIKSVIKVLNTQNSSASLPVLYDLKSCGQLNVETILSIYPALMTYTGTDQRAAAKSAFQSANTAYQTGSASIRARGVQPGKEFVISIFPADAANEERFRTRLAGVSASLDGSTLIDGLPLNLTSALTTATQARSLLPQFKGNYILPSTWPDATMGGTFPSGTQAIMNQAMTDVNLLSGQIAITVSGSPSAYGDAFVSRGSKLMPGSTVKAYAFPAYGFTFVNWTEGGTPVSTSQIYEFKATANRALVANFAIPPGYFAVSLSGSPAGAGFYPSSSAYLAGSQVSVYGYAYPGYTFVNWTEGGNQVSNSIAYTFNIMGNRNLIANYTLNPGYYTVTANSAPADAGFAFPSPPYPYAAGSTATVNAFAGSGYVFTGWSEGGNPVSTLNPYSFPVSGARSLVANFKAICCVLAVPSPAAGGTVAVSGSGLIPGVALLPPAAGVSVAGGTSVNLTATPNAGYAFTNWTEDGISVSSNAAFVITPATSRTFVANFVPTATSYTVTPTAGANGKISLSTVQMVNSGASMTFSAIPNSGYRVSQWLVNGVTVQVNGVTYTGLSIIVGPVTSNTTVQVSFASAQGSHYWESTALTASANAAVGKRTGVAHASWPLYYYKGSDSNIWCVYYGGGTSWTQAPLTTAANVDDWLTVLPYYNLLCYRGTDGHLYAVYLNGSTWATAKLSNVTANVAGDLAVDPVRNVVYYRGTDGGLWVAYINGNVWSQLSLTGVYGFPAIVGGDLSVDANSHFVYFRGTDSHLYVAYYTGSTWLQVKLTTTPNVGGALTADSGYLLYYRSSADNTPWAAYFNSVTWAQVQLDGGTTMSTGTSVTALYALHTWLYLDANGQCGAEYVNGNAWTHIKLGDGGSDMVGGLSVQHGTNWGFAQRRDGHVLVFYYR